MKNFLIRALILILCIGTNKMLAQKGFSISVKTIPQFSFLENKDDNNNSSFKRIATFNAGFGIGAGYDFNDKYGIGLDLLYSLQGQRYKYTGIEYNQKVDYIKVPVYFVYNGPISSTVSFLGKIGPQVSFLTDSKLNDKDGNTIDSDTKDRFKSATFGGVIIAGTQFKLKSDLFLSTAIRFDYDFTNAEDNSYINYQSGRANSYNATAGLELGLKYMLK